MTLSDSLGWSLLETEGVMEVIERASTKVADHYSVDHDDLMQEATILVATKPDHAAAIHEGSLGLLSYQLERDLVNIAHTGQSRAQRSTSYEERYMEQYENLDAPVDTPQRPYASTYTVELVEALLPAVWDDSYCYGVRAENAPDPDMPRGTINKSTGNTAAAHFADIKRAWEKCNLTPSERQALFLRYSQDLTQKDSAKVLVCSQSVVSRWIASGVERLLGFLNGAEVAE